MANTSLLNANAALVQANSYDPASEIVSQFGNIMKAENDFRVKLNEEATEASENLAVDAVGIDNMSEEAQAFMHGELDDHGMKIAKARRAGDKNLVRKLEMEGANLIATQNEIGSLLKDHAENKLQGNYSGSADQTLMDMLITKKYTLVREEAEGPNKGKIKIKFNMQEDHDFTAQYSDPVKQEEEISRIQSEIQEAKDNGTEADVDVLEKELESIKGRGYANDLQNEGVFISDLDKHIRVKNDAQADEYTGLLSNLAENSNKGMEFSADENETKKIIKNVVNSTDNLQTAIYDDSFSQDGKTLAVLWAEELKAGNIKVENEEGEMVTLDPNENPNSYLRSSGSKYKDYESSLKEWTEDKLLQGAKNHHKANNQEDNNLNTEAEKRSSAAVSKVDDFMASSGDFSDTGVVPSTNSMINLQNETTKVVWETDGDNKIVEPRRWSIQKWTNGAWTEKHNLSFDDTPDDVLSNIFKRELGANQ